MGADGHGTMLASSRHLRRNRLVTIALACGLILAIVAAGSALATPNVRAASHVKRHVAHRARRRTGGHRARKRRRTTSHTARKAHAAKRSRRKASLRAKAASATRVAQRTTAAVQPASSTTKPAGSQTVAAPQPTSATTASVSAPVTSVASTNLGPVPTGVHGAWQLKFDDEFSESSLDLSKWSTGWFGSGITQAVNTTGEQNCYDPSMVSLAGGALNLQATLQRESCGGTSQPYAASLINTDGKFSYTYGMYEARVWMPGTGGKIADWPAIWADGQNWPYDGEIDVVEGLSGDSCFHFHYSGGGPGGCSDITNVTQGWHTFAADWEPGSIVFYYDGTAVGRETVGVTNQPMYLILDLAVPNSSWASATSQTMRVDYIRVWQHA